MDTLRQRNLLLSLKYSTIEACFSVPMLNLTMPSFPFVIAFAVTVLGWQSAAIGVMAALPHLCNFVQPPITIWLRRRFSIYQIISIGFLGSAIPWGFIAIMPWLQTAQGLLFALILGTATLSNSIAAVAWSAAISEVVPPRISGRYFGQRNLIFGFWSLLVVLAAGKFADQGQGTLTTFAWIFAGAGLGRLIGYLFLTRMHFPSTVMERDPQNPDWSDYNAPLKDKNYMQLALFIGLWGFLLNLSLPFHPVYLLNELKLQVGDVVIFATLAGIGGLATLRGWGKLCDRFGNKPVLIITSLVWSLAGIATWTFAGPRWNLHLYPAYLIMGATTAGFQLCQFNLMLKLAPPRKTPFVAIFMALTSLLTALGPVLGGAILRWTPTYLGAIGGKVFLNYHALFVGSFAGCLLMIFLLRRVHEVESGNTHAVWHSMRNMRAFNPLLTMTTAAQLIFTPRGLMGITQSSIRELKRQARSIGNVGEEIVQGSRQALAKSSFNPTTKSGVVKKPTPPRSTPDNRPGSIDKP